MTEEIEDRDRIHTAELVAAYVSNNHIAPADLPILIATVQHALSALSGPTTPNSTTDKPETPTPAQIRKSITPDALISFIDGKPYKMLKRHLRTHGLDQQGYRERYGLPTNYPMVAPSYSTRRVELSRSFQAARGKRV